ncbi:ribonuclease T2 family protein [Aestuariispira insulae]|uniref:Ribonuclease T2 n=1 Tax=Aestuariispira insulae TaxID=1461337 RepID=A0A3D9HVI3_9PROT|nr:hypothetical protein [Aestuariispira insulae]RED53502.1 ribonuclease T2 [Aestuariispira insulae]
MKYSLAALFLSAIALSKTGWSADPDMEWVQALSWEPAFCETVSHRPVECKTAREDDYAASNLVLHGLWPETGQYCGVSEKNQQLDKDRQWAKLPETELPLPLRDELAQKMPGVASHLDRHEWIKHGTCSGLNAGGYYRLSLDLVDAAEKLETTRLLRDNIGKTIAYRDLCNSLTHDFGPVGPQAVKVRQKKSGSRFNLVELQFALKTGPDGKLRLSREDLRPIQPIKCDNRKLHIDPSGP